jgi:peptidoglycan/LPS O-acetylase OafA/YrhL
MLMPFGGLATQSTTLGMQSVGFTWMALFYVVILLLAVGYPGSWIASIFRNKWLRELGVVSYCVYIIHIVVNVVLHALLLHKGPRISTGKGAIVTVIAGFVTYGIAKISWLLFEGPLQRRGHAFKY